VSPDGTTLVQISGTAYTVWRLDGAGPVTALLGDPAAQWVNGYAPNGDVLVGQAGAPIRLLDPVSGAEHGQLAGVEQIVPDPSGGTPAAVYLDHTIGWYDLAHQAPAGPKAPLPLPSEQLIPLRNLDEMLLFQGVTVIGRRAVMFTNTTDDAGVRLHVRSVDLDKGSATTPTLDEAAASHERWLFAPDDHHLYSYNWDFDIHQLDPETGAEGKDFGGDYNDVFAGPGGIVAALLSGDVVQLDPNTLGPVGVPFPASRGLELDLGVSGDGRRVVQVGSLGIRLYDLPTHTQLGEAMTPLDGMADATRGLRDKGVALRQDGKAAVAMSAGGLVSWDLDPDHWEAKACDIAGRNLTPSEWTKYVRTLDGYHAICPQFALTT
jgi:hypothetical protein